MVKVPAVTTRVLLIEDNPDDVLLVRRLLRPWEVEHVPRLTVGVERLTSPGIDVVLSDLTLPDAEGLQAVLEVRERFPTVPLVIMTGSCDEDRAVEAIRAGAQDYVFKDQMAECGLPRVLRYAVERQRAEAERDALLAQLQAKVAELETALANVRTLSGLLPMCADCKKIRDDSGYWENVADYITSQTGTLFTHGLCPPCLAKNYPGRP